MLVFSRTSTYYIIYIAKKLISFWYIHPPVRVIKRKLTEFDCEDEPDHQNIINTEEPNENNKSCYLFDGKHFKIINTNNDTNKKCTRNVNIVNK